MLRAMTRRAPATLANLEDQPELETVEAPGVMPPPGVPAQIKTEIRYQRTIDPSTENVSQYPNDLAQLAAAEDETLLPSDPLSVFVETWRDYEGLSLRIARLPDPAARRMRGQTYARPWFGEVENLGDIPFDPANLISTLQIINGNSGGVFRLWLADESGRPIPGAKLDRVAIADPPRHASYDDPRFAPVTQHIPPPQPTERQPSAMELRVQELQERIFNQALDNALKPAPAPAPVASSDPFAGLSEEDRLTLLLVKRGDVLSQITQRVTSLAQAPDNTPEKLDWKDRGLNALVGLVETNPVIVERVSSIIERIVNRVIPDPRTPQPSAYNPTPYQGGRIETTPQALPPSPLPPQQITGIPETPHLDEDNDQDAEIMDILERLFELFSDTRPITANDQVFIDLRQAYPLKFKIAIGLIKKTDLPDLVAWISEQSPLYETMLTSPATSPHYIARLKELKTLVDSLGQPQTAQTAQIIHEPPQAQEPAIQQSAPPPVVAPAPGKARSRSKDKAD